MAPQDPPVVAPTTITLATLIDQLQAAEALQNPDQVLSVHSLRMTEAGTIETPSGASALTDWSRKQLAGFLGVNWNRWFQGAHPQDRAQEVNRRLARMDGSTKVRLRTSRKAPEGVDADPTLQAL